MNFDIFQLLQISISIISHYSSHTMAASQSETNSVGE